MGRGRQAEPQHPPLHYPHPRRRGGRPGQFITLAGIVTAYRTRTTRNNTLMAYAAVEDDTGSIELLCFK